MQPIQSARDCTSSTGSTIAIGSPTRMMRRGFFVRETSFSRVEHIALNSETDISRIFDCTTLLGARGLHFQFPHTQFLYLSLQFEILLLHLLNFFSERGYLYLQSFELVL